MTGNISEWKFEEKQDLQNLKLPFLDSYELQKEISNFTMEKTRRQHLYEVTKSNTASDKIHWHQELLNTMYSEGHIISVVFLSKTA